MENIKLVTRDGLGELVCIWLIVDFTYNFAIRDAYLSDYWKFFRDKYGLVKLYENILDYDRLFIKNIIDPQLQNNLQPF